jgi:hypothetical protein
MSSPQVGDRRLERTQLEGLRVTSPAPRDVWEAALTRDPDALVSQTPAWVDCARAFGYTDASRLYELPRGARFVLPMVRRSGPWPPELAPRASMPFAWGMGGLIAEEPPLAPDLAAIVADLRAGHALRTAIRPNPLQAWHWAGVSGPGVTAIQRRAHVLDLEGGAAHVWRRFRKSAREGVRKAERSGLEIECDTSGRLVPVFFDLLERSVERWARQQNEPLWLARWRLKRRDPVEKFERLAATMGQVMRIWVARKDGSPAASMIVLLGANASDTRGAMDKALAGPTNANDLLQWLAIEDACQAGCRHYHLGESGFSRSLGHFKEKFGARPVPYTEHRIERLPLTRAEGLARGLVKRLLRFRDA